MSGLRARKISADDFERFDYVVAMDHGHFKILHGLSGKNAERLSLF
jgi:protein-tyrosine-phosphatase